MLPQQPTTPINHCCPLPAHLHPASLRWLCCLPSRSHGRPLRKCCESWRLQRPADAHQQWRWWQGRGWHMQGGKSVLTQGPLHLAASLHLRTLVGVHAYAPKHSASHLIPAKHAQPGVHSQTQSCPPCTLAHRPPARDTWLCTAHLRQPACRIGQRAAARTSAHEQLSAPCGIKLRRSRSQPCRHWQQQQQPTGPAPDLPPAAAP